MLQQLFTHSIQELEQILVDSVMKCLHTISELALYTNPAEYVSLVQRKSLSLSHEKSCVITMI